MNSVYLRAFELGDYHLIQKWRNNPSIQKLTSGDFRYVSSEMEKEWVKDKIEHNIDDVYLAICSNDDGQLIGYTSINAINHIHRTAVGGGIVIGEKNFQDGVCAIDALLLVLSHVFDNLNINRFSGSCLSEQINTQLLLEILGFTKEGVKRQAIYKNGKYHDQYVYSILRDEYYQKISSNDYSFIEIIKKIKKYKNKKNII